MTRAHKIVKVDLMLRQGKFPSRGDIAAELNCDIRTVNRLLKFMREEQNAPIAYSKEKGGYYFLENSFAPPTSRLGNKELAYLFFSQQVLEQYEGTPLLEQMTHTAIQMAESLGQDVAADYNWLDSHVTFIHDPAPTIAEDIWLAIIKALKSQTTVNVSYQLPSALSPVTRTLHIYHIAHYKRNWYIAARNIESGNLRTYAISRIKDVTPLNSTYAIPEDFDAKSMFANGIFGAQVNEIVRLWVSKEQAPYIQERQWHKDEKKQMNNDGSLELSFPITEYYEIKRWVLSQGRHVKIIEPEELRLEVEDEIKEMVGLYLPN